MTSETFRRIAAIIPKEFYAPDSVLFNSPFVRTQDDRNMISVARQIAGTGRVMTITSEHQLAMINHRLREIGHPIIGYDPDISRTMSRAEANRLQRLMRANGFSADHPVVRAAYDNVAPTVVLVAKASEWVNIDNTLSNAALHGVRTAPAQGGAYHAFAFRGMIISRHSPLHGKLPTPTRDGSPQHNYELTGFRKRHSGNPRYYHAGVDFAVPRGTPVLSPVYGRVTRAYYSETYGYSLEIADSEAAGVAYFFAHLAEMPKVKVGELVKRGQPVAQVGSTGRSTGPHLHYEIRERPSALTPVRVDIMKALIKEGFVDNHLLG